MIRKIHNTRGQTAIVLILLAAAGLIFYASTLNWGRIAQEKSMLTISADQAASTLASDAASYGEMEKVQYLKDQNYKTTLQGWLISAILIVVIVALVIINAVLGGSLTPFLVFLIAATIAMAAVNIVLQLVVLNPMITNLWNKAQKNQSVQQQFYEGGGIQTALTGSVTDQVNITDYFDENANGVYGVDPASGPKDSISRFAFFYTERLKMINNAIKPFPQIQAFYNSLEQFVNGSGGGWVGLYLNDPVSAQDTNLNDPGYNMSVTSPNYNPFADPCCQPMTGEPDPFFNPNSADHTAAFVNLRPSYCRTSSICSDTANSCMLACQTAAAAAGKAPGADNDAISAQQDNCQSQCASAASAASCAPAAPECVNNNPYTCDDLSVCSNGLCKDGTPCGLYPYLYDPTYQNNYGGGSSFLDKFGRDVQMYLPNGGFSPSPYAPNWTPQGIFPNGVYPFFWIMANDNPQVDNITAASGSGQAHWCTTATAPLPPPVSLANPNVTNYPQLCQLGVANGECHPTGSVNCLGPTCCIGNLSNNVSNLACYTQEIDAVADPSVLGTTLTAAEALAQSNPADDPSFGEPAPPAASGGAYPWAAGDNQFCSATWPYNESSQSIPDGICELNPSPANPQPASSYTDSTIPVPASGSSVDNLDNVMHTLSDFVNFANNFLGQDINTLNTTFSSWYPQAAEWIAPACAGAGLSDPADACTSCTDGSSPLATNPLTCNEGSDGRLLSIYNPYANPPVDLLNTWAGSLYQWFFGTSWLSDTAWCLSGSGSSINPPDPTMYIMVNGVLTPTAEQVYITHNVDRIGNAGAGIWGNLNHVNACLLYNDVVAPVSYKACRDKLAELNVTVPGTNQNNCTALPDVCNPVTLGRSLTGLPAPAFVPTATLPNSSTGACPESSCSSSTSDPVSTPCPAAVPPEASGQCSPPAPYTFVATAQCPGVGSVISTTTTTTCGTSGGATILSPCDSPNDPQWNTTTYNYCTSIISQNVSSSCCANYPYTFCCQPGNAACVNYICICTTPNCDTSVTQPTSCTSTLTTNVFNSSSCDASVPGSYANWVSNSYTLAADAQPKFDLRYQFLSYAYSAAKNIWQFLSNADIALTTGSPLSVPPIPGFLQPCGNPQTDPTCQQGGPVAQLMYARTLVDPAMMLPNAVIYGWVDKNLPSGQPGSAHIVKVTAYSPGRCGSAGNVVPDCISNVIVPGANPHQIDQLLPWVQTSSTAFHHKFTLTDRDEHVYVKVQRWDQDHANALTFPNNLPLWQFAFHNPKASPVAPSALPSACFFSSLGGPLMGYGLTSGIQQALGNSFIVANVLPADLTAMGNAFMLNDEGTGPNAGSVDPNGKNPTYLTCLQQADALLNSGISSTACAAYVASDSPGTSLNNGSQRSDRNYKIYFLPCPTPLPPDDLTGHSPG